MGAFASACGRHATAFSPAFPDAFAGDAVAWTTVGAPAQRDNAPDRISVMEKTA
jgi:plastocyanin